MSGYHFTISVSLSDDYKDKETARHWLEKLLENIHPDLGIEYTLIDDEDFIEYMKHNARIRHG